MTDRIPIADLRAQLASIRPRVDSAIAETLDSGIFVRGPKVARFEERFADACGTRHAVGTASGTSALHVALLASDVGPGDEVVVPAFSFVATAEAVVHCGATPVFVDVEEDTLCIDPRAVEDALSPKTRAIIAVHLYGQCADLDALAALASRKDLALIEDAAQAFGAPVGERHAGSVGRFGCFSLYPSKNLSAYGDGGVLVCDDDHDVEHVRMLIDHGRRQKNDHDIIGFNYRLDAIQAAIADVKLDHVEAWTDRRRQLAARYDQSFASLPVRPMRVVRGHAHHLYVVRCEGRDSLSRHLDEAGISSAVHYPRPLHRQRALARWAPRGTLPISERASQQVLTLPLFPELSDAQQARIVDAVEAWARR